jgi:hypothetical protein
MTRLIPLVCWTRIYSSVCDIRTYCRSTPFQNNFAAFQRDPLPHGIPEQVRELYNVIEVLQIMEAGTADAFLDIARTQLDRILEALFDDTINNLEVTFFNILMKSVKSYQEAHKVRCIVLTHLTYKDPRIKGILRDALLYHSLSKLSHGLMRSAVYEQYDGGLGVAPRFRLVFQVGVGPWSANLTQLTNLANERAAILEKSLLDEVDHKLRRFSVESCVPMLVILSILVDQMDNHFHQGRWLMYPQDNLRVRKCISFQC